MKLWVICIEEEHRIHTQYATERRWMSQPSFQDDGFLSIAMAHKADWMQLKKHWSVVSLNLAGYCFTTWPYNTGAHKCTMIQVYPNIKHV